MSSGCPVSPLGRLLLQPLCPIAKGIFKKVFNVSVKGTENVPQGPCLVVSNHRSHLDPLVLNSVFPEPLRFLAKEGLFKLPILGPLLPHMGAVPVRRGSGDVEALKTALKLLYKGCKVCIFPEGTRANPGEFLKPKLGAGFIAIKSAKPILPVYVGGTDVVMPRGASFPKLGHPIKVVIGRTFTVTYLEDNLKGYRHAVSIMMEKIKELSLEA